VAISPGDKIGRYTIVSFIGAGGMGQVFRARDAQLGRDVALKFLPASSAGKPRDVARFRQEARALGLLNHPNLVTVFDFGEHEDTFFIVLEMLEGETLRQRLRDSGALSQRRAVQYAIGIARGMAAAHDRGITHRDLKPENIFLTVDGGLKILDFGLAQMRPTVEVAPDDDESPTLIGGGTDPGMLVGTVGYIAPEQLRGEEVDHRADIFAFGGILFEMLTGRRVFKGSTAVETLSAVLKDDPDPLSDSGVTVSPGLELIVQRCLEKLPRNRFQSAHDLSLAIEALDSSTESLTSPFARSMRGRARGLRRAAILAAATIAAVALGAFLWSRLAPRQPPMFRQLTFRRGDISAARFAPDGGVVYSVSWDGRGYELYSGRIDSVDARPLGIASRELLAVSRKWDLAMMVKPNEIGGTLAIASLSGGAPREVSADIVAADFSPDGKDLAVARRLLDGSYQIEYPLGRTIHRTATRIRDLRLSPDGHLVAFRLREARLGKAFALFVVRTDGKEPRKIGEWSNAKGLAWSADGDRIVIGCSGNNGSTELRSVSLRGSSSLLTTFDGSVKLHDISGSGALLFTRDDYREGIMGRAPGAGRERDLSWFDGSGASDISPDGRLLVLSEFGEAGGPRYSAYVRPMNGDPAVRLGDGYAVSLSPDGGSTLTIIPGLPARLAIVPLGAGATRVLDPGDVEDYEFGAWMPDGRSIVFTGRTAKGRMRLYRQDVSRGRPVPIAEPGLRLALASRPASPDGKRLAVVGDDGSIVIIGADGKGPQKKLPLDSQFRPIVWSRDGRELFVYRENELPARLFRVNIDSGELRFVQELMPADPAGVYRIMDVVTTPDGNAYAYGVMRNLSTLFYSKGW